MYFSSRSSSDGTASKRRSFERPGNPAVKRFGAALCVFLFALTVLLPIGSAPVNAEEETELFPDGAPGFHIQPVDETIRGGRRDGFEPHILAGPSEDGTGEWYYYDSPSGLLSPGVSNSRRPGNIWISKDYGMTWEFKEKDNAIVDLLPQDPGGSGDTYTAVATNGALFHTDLYLASASVDMTLDGGENWYLNPVASNYLLDDRQWLDVGPALDGIGDETVYFSFNQLSGLGLVMTKAPVYFDSGIDNYLWTPCNNGLPITTDVSARDVFCVDEESGIIYISNYASGSGELEVWRSMDGGESFTQHFVMEAGVRADVQNIFTVIDTDIEGNVYIGWSSRDHIWMATSTDQAETWSIHQVTEDDITSVKVLPWLAAGDGDMVGLGWYEAEPGTSGSPDVQHESWWDVRASFCFDATADEPHFDTFVIDEAVHYGGIQTTGTGGGSDRDLGDYLAVEIDGNGRLLLSYGEDGDDGANARLSYPMYAGQLDGPFLRENTGPFVAYDMKKDGQDVSLDLTGTTDLGGMDLMNITVNWGDGDIWIGAANELEVKHSYPDKEKKYHITITATNEIGMRSAESASVSIEGDDEWSLGSGSGFIICCGPAILLVVLIVAVFVVIGRKKKDTIPEAAPLADMIDGEEKTEAKESGTDTPVDGEAEYEDALPVEDDKTAEK